MGFQKGREKTGGRKPGVLNHATRERRRALLSSGLSPLDYLCSVFRDPNEPTNLRISAAQSVASYVYPKLTAIDVNARSDQPLVVQVVKFHDLPLADQRAPTIDVIPDAVVQDDDEAGEAA